MTTTRPRVSFQNSGGSSRQRTAGRLLLPPLARDGHCPYQSSGTAARLQVAPALLGMPEPTPAISSPMEICMSSNPFRCTLVAGAIALAGFASAAVAAPADTTPDA